MLLEEIIKLLISSKNNLEEKQIKIKNKSLEDKIIALDIYFDKSFVENPTNVYFDNIYTADYRSEESFLDLYNCKMFNKSKPIFIKDNNIGSKEYLNNKNSVEHQKIILEYDYRHLGTSILFNSIIPKKIDNNYYIELFQSVTGKDNKKHFRDIIIPYNYIFKADSLDRALMFLGNAKIEKRSNSKVSIVKIVREKNYTTFVLDFNILPFQNYDSFVINAPYINLGGNRYLISVDGSQQNHIQIFYVLNAQKNEQTILTYKHKSELEDIHFTNVSFDIRNYIDDPKEVQLFYSYFIQVYKNCCL